MKTNSLSLVFACLVLSTTSLAGDLEVMAGYTWRQRARTDFSAGVSAAAGGSYRNGYVNSDTDWSFDGTFEEGRYYDPGYTEPLYSMGLEQSESVGGGSDETSASGFTAGLGYDLWGNELFAVGLSGRFAGYWNMRNVRPGGYREYTDQYSFAAPTPSMGYGPPVPGDPATYEGRTYGAGGASPRMSLKADLYQIGFGPKLTWHVLGCLDVYGGVEALCNLIHSDLEAGGASADETNCRLGFGGNVGFTGWITENVGFYGQIGYEWIDEDDVSAKGITASTDYSSLVLSAGLRCRF